MIAEADVTLTDYAIAVECAWFVRAIYRRSRKQPLRFWWLLFFGSIGVVSAAGGTVHGFFGAEQTIAAVILWAGALIAAGVTAFAAWGIGAHVLFSPVLARRIAIAAAVELALYCAIVLLVTQEFWIVIANYLPASLFLLTALIARSRREKNSHLRPGIVGLVLTLVAAAVQQAGISIHPKYFNHNAFYHVIQGVALFMIFSSARFIGGVYADET